MGAGLRGIAVVVVVLGVGAFLGSAMAQWWNAPLPTTGPAPDGEGRTVVPVVTERVRVEVLNGGGRAGMARAATERLRDVGFDVVYWGNAERFDYDSSTVLDRGGRGAEWAGAVAGALGIERVRAEPDSNLYLDLSVVLGADWTPEAIPRPRPPAPEPAWWDLRRYFRETGGTAPPSGGRMADPGDEDGDGG